MKLLPKALLITGIGGTVATVLGVIFSHKPEPSPDQGAPVPDDPSKPLFPYNSIAPGKYLRTDAADAFNAMKKDAAKAGVSLPVSTAWRSNEYQQRLYDAWLAYKAGTGPYAAQAAKPGRSLHQKGIAVDLTGVNPAAKNFNATRRLWLDTHAYKYGFYNTGKYFRSKEPWHWAYGVEREGSALVA